jgi:ribosomal protein L37AE/L43A
MPVPPLAAYADTGVPLADEPYYCQSCERDTSFRRRADGAWFCTQCGTHFDADAGTNDYPFDATDDCPHCKTATLFRTLNAGTRFCTVCGTHDPTWADRAAPSALSHAAAPALSRTIIGARDLVYDDVRPSMPLPDDRHLQLAPPYSAAQWPEALALLEHARGDPKRFVIRRDHVSGYPPYTTLVACRLPGSPGRWVNLLVAFAEERGD